MKRWMWAALVLSLGCETPAPGFAPEDAQPLDAAASDAGADATNDAAPTDAAAPDAAAMDAQLADADLSDAQQPDAQQPDAQQPDAQQPDAQLLDAAIVDALLPDACVPACGGRACGDDGCGAPCGRCEDATPLCIGGACLAPPDVIISELLARNDGGLEDEDGDAEDWIELHNRALEPVDLTDWALTDDLDALDQWRLPALVIPPGGRVVIFASGKDRTDLQAPLHTNFRLSGDGEDLALVYRDGQTVVHQWTPYPSQHPNISYGPAETVTASVLLAEGATAHYRLPADDDWTTPDYDHADWAQGPTALGFAGERVMPDPEDLENVAVGQPARQTSQLGGFAPGLAVNGNRGDFTHTHRDDQAPEWTVDLGAEQAIARVVVHNRSGCCGTRLRDITVALTDADGQEVWASALLNPENTLGSPAQLVVEPNTIAREIHVRRTVDLDLSGTNGAGNDDEATVLSLGEVEVFAGEGGVGPHLTSDVGALMRGVSRGLQVRIPFDVLDPAVYSQLTLRVDHDAGFVAWLNGVPVARVRAPDAALPNGALPSDAEATAEAPEPVTQIELDLTAALRHLRPGANVLALHALTADDDDFLLHPTLSARTITAGDVRYLTTPTPGGPNESLGFAGIIAPVDFDLPHGWYDAPTALTLSTNSHDALIHYTTDGSRPDEASPIYEAPLPLTGSTVVRAGAFQPDWRPTRISTATYLFADDVISQTHDAVIARGFPESWGGTAADYAVDPRIVGPGDAFDGRYAATIRDDLRAIPTLALSTETAGLFGPDGIYTHSRSSGLAWERPTALELIEAGPDAGPGFQVDCGLRMQGGAFRSHGLTLKHSLRVLFKGAYGPTKLRWPLLGDEATDRFDTLTLRSNSNDGWQWGAAGGQPLYIRDTFGRHTMLAMGGVASHAAFFHLFINGVYWGVYEATERPDAAFSATYLGGDKVDWDGQNSGSAVDGDLIAWNTLLTRLTQGVDTLQDWYELQGLDDDGLPDAMRPAWVDMRNLADYMLTNLYVGNSDWPRKNFYLGRPRDGSLGFHFYMWDSEWSLGLRSNLGTDRTGVSVGVAQPWQALKANPEFRLLVADRARAHLTTPGGALWVNPEAPQWDPEHPEHNVPAARFSALAASVERPLVAESARWGDQHRAATPYTVDAEWATERDTQLAAYFPERSARFLDQLRAADLYPVVPPVAPSHWGGRVAPGFALDLNAEQGAVYYTLDGGDPRLPGGEPSPAALIGDAHIALMLDQPDLNLEIHTRARLEDGTWSALTRLQFTVFR